jgi:hypothetical protein
MQRTHRLGANDFAAARVHGPYQDIWIHHAQGIFGTALIYFNHDAICSPFLIGHNRFASPFYRAVAAEQIIEHIASVIVANTANNNSGSVANFV